MATALADGDWAEVRRLSPTDTRTEAELERDYAGLGLVHDRARP